MENLPGKSGIVFKRVLKSLKSELILYFSSKDLFEELMYEWHNFGDRIHSMFISGFSAFFQPTHSPEYFNTLPYTTSTSRLIMLSAIFCKVFLFAKVSPQFKNGIFSTDIFAPLFMALYTRDHSLILMCQFFGISLLSKVFCLESSVDYNVFKVIDSANSALYFFPNSCITIKNDCNYRKERFVFFHGFELFNAVV